MADFIQRVIEYNGKICDEGIILSDGQYFSTEIFSDKDGFFAIDFKYEHNDWDQWIEVIIKSETGETIEYMPTLPGKRNSNTVIMHLFKGVNKITVTHSFGHELKILDTSVSDKRPLLKSTVTPSEDYFYLDKSDECRIFLLSYAGDPIAVKLGDNDINFRVEVCRFDDTDDKYYSGDALIRRYICIDKQTLVNLGIDNHIFKIVLPDGSEIEYELHIRQSEEKCKLKIVSLDVGHGNASLLCLPNGKNLMIDSGYAPRSREVIVNYLQEYGLKVDYYLLTHFHADHDGMLAELFNEYSLYRAQSCEVKNYISADASKRAEYLSAFSYLDSTMLCRYDKLHKIWDLGGVEITVLNSRFDEKGDSVEIQNDPDIVYNEYNYENSTSISLLVRYNGFGYYHGADSYSYVQQKNLEDFKVAGKENQLKCQYFYANHHFHNDVNPEFIKAVNPVAVYVPANQGVYSRSAFCVIYKNEIAEADYEGKRLRETFISHQNGTVIVNVNSGDDWYYYALGDIIKNETSK